MADQLLGGIIINEVLVDPNGTNNFDTDGDGTARNRDEFIELKNVSDTPIDISGVQLWDAGQGNWFTFPAGTILQPGAHATVVIDVRPGGSLPTGDPDDLFFDADNGTAVFNNARDNIVVYDPANDEYIQAIYNNDSVDDPTTAYSGFSTTATQVGTGEDFGSTEQGLSFQRVPSGSDTFVSDTPTPGADPICFVKGTHFASPTGPITVEHLVPGTRLITADHGVQTVRWVFSNTFSVCKQQNSISLRPVKISKGALGDDLPHDDLYVSQQHRVLISSAIAKRMFGAKQVLVAAKNLIGLDGISITPGTKPVTYYHVMMDRHEILFSEGAMTESLYLGSEALKSISKDALAEISQLLDRSIPELRTARPAQARPFARGHRARRLAFRHIKNDKPLAELTHDPQSSAR